MSGVIQFISQHGALPFAAALFFYSFIHKDAPLKAACSVSSGFYALCYYLQQQTTEYTDFYPLFLTIDIVWLLMLLTVCGVSRLIAGTFAVNMFILSAMPLILVNHWFFHGLYDYLYVGLQLIFLATLTVLPQKYPRLFASPYNEKDDDRGSFVAFVAGVTSKNFCNFIASRGIQ